jgi:hypothetical protein
VLVRLGKAVTKSPRLYHRTAEFAILAADTAALANIQHLPLVCGRRCSLVSLQTLRHSLNVFKTFLEVLSQFLITRNKKSHVKYHVREMKKAGWGLDNLKEGKGIMDQKVLSPTSASETYRVQIIRH